MEHDDQPKPPVLFGSVLIFLLLLVVYILTMSGRHYSIDGMAMYQQSKMLLFHQTLRFSPPFVWGTYRSEYIFWPEGLSIVYLIPLAIFSYLIFPHDPTFRIVPSTPAILLHDPSYIQISVTNSIITALTASVIYAVAMRLHGSRRAAIVSALVFGLASPALAYQKQDFAQPLAALLIVTTMLLYIMAFGQTQANTRYLYAWLSGLCLGFLLLTRSESLLIVIPIFVLFAIVQLRRLRWYEQVLTSVALLLPILLFAVLHAYITFIKTGSLLGVQGSAFAQSGDQRAFFTAFFGLLISPGRGLLIFFPLALYAPFGLRRMVAHMQLRHWTVVFGSIIVLHIAFFSIWPIWWGGLSWGPRYLLPILPLLTLLAFWPPATNQPQSSLQRAYVTRLMKLLAIAIGFVMALSGVLLSWDAIEARDGFPPGAEYWSIIEQGQWFFRLETNTVWTNWQDIGNVARYDLLVAQSAGQGIVRDKLIVVLGCTFVFIIASLLLHWRRRMQRNS